jgi:hypothetical protein
VGFNLIENDNVIISPKIRNLAMLFGIPVNLGGYLYIVYAISYMAFSQHCEVRFLSEVYKSIAETFDSTSECVEISIRNAIKSAGNRKTEKYKEYFGESDKKPSNALFLNTLKEIFLIEQGKI